MRVLHLLNSLNRRAGGVAAFVVDVAAAVAATGAQVTVRTGDDADIPMAWGGTKTPAVQVSEAGEPGSAKLRAAIQEADVVHLHGPWARENAAAATVCRATGTPYVVSLHGMIDHWSMNNTAVKSVKKRIYLAAGGRKMLNSAAFVHCTAHAEADAAAFYLPKANFFVIPCVVEAGELAAISREPLKAPREPLRILFLSRLHPKKRPDLLISAIANLPNARLVLAGPGETAYVAKLTRLASELGVENRVDFPGMLRDHQRLAAYGDADCFALPTSQENFGIVLAEAMAAGLPTITTRGTAIWREIESAGAWIVDQTPESLATAIQTIASDRPGAAVRGLRGRAFVLEQFSAERLGPTYRDLYLSAKERQAT